MGYMPFITKENAGDLARKATEARVRNWNEAEDALEEKRARIQLSPAEASEPLRTARIQKQIELIDIDIEDKRTNGELRVKLIAAKGRLWELIYPKPGSRKPASEKPAKRGTPAPQPQETQPETQHVQPLGQVMSNPRLVDPFSEVVLAPEIDLGAGI